MGVAGLGRPNPGVPGQDGATPWWVGASVPAWAGRWLSSDARGAGGAPRQRVAMASGTACSTPLVGPRWTLGVRRPWAQHAGLRLRRGGQDQPRTEHLAQGTEVPAALVFELRVLNAY